MAGVQATPREAIELAHRYGFAAVEPSAGFLAGLSDESLSKLLTEMNNVGFMLDSWLWYTAQEAPADILSLCAADVIYCHLNDAPKGIPVDQQVDDRRDLPAATGVIDLAGFLQSLARIGRD
jgi:sugar phosphate isomerase/epimerase